MSSPMFLLRSRRPRHPYELVGRDVELLPLTVRLDEIRGRRVETVATPEVFSAPPPAKVPECP